MHRARRPCWQDCTGIKFPAMAHAADRLSGASFRSKQAHRPATGKTKQSIKRPGRRGIVAAGGAAGVDRMHRSASFRGTALGKAIALFGAYVAAIGVRLLANYADTRFDISGLGVGDMNNACLTVARPGGHDLDDVVRSRPHPLSSRADLS